MAKKLQEHDAHPTSAPRRFGLLAVCVALTVAAAAWLTVWQSGRQRLVVRSPVVSQRSPDSAIPRGVPERAAPEAVTAKVALELAATAARSWRATAQPVSLTSGSDVALDGRSLLWEVTFAAPGGRQLATYHVTVESGRVATSAPGAASEAVVVPVPASWSDSGEAIRRALALLRVSELTVEHMAFAQNTGGQTWHWSLTTSAGAVSMLAAP